VAFRMVGRGSDNIDLVVEHLIEQDRDSVKIIRAVEIRRDDNVACGVSKARAQRRPQTAIDLVRINAELPSLTKMISTSWASCSRVTTGRRFAAVCATPSDSLYAGIIRDTFIGACPCSCNLTTLRGHPA
jgi:hypothetical protein